MNDTKDSTTFKETVDGLSDAIDRMLADDERLKNINAELLAACLAAHAWFASHGDSLPSSAVRVVTILGAAIAQAEQR